MSVNALARSISLSEGFSPGFTLLICARAVFFIVFLGVGWYDRVVFGSFVKRGCFFGFFGFYRH